MPRLRPQILLLRHGIAEERSPDRADGRRALTPAGRRRTAAVLERAVAIGLRVDRLITSPLLRARQTAEIALATGLTPAVELATALEPGGDPLPFLPLWLAGGPVADWGDGPRARRVALVGHEPDLGELAARLIGAPAGSISLRKAGLALLEHPDAPVSLPQAPGGEWLLRLLLTPRALLS
jgi:phosphohistidine phosphatase